MNGALRAKLENPANFGPNGIADCGVTLKKLPFIEGVETIEECDCDIVFTGQFPGVDFSGAPDGRRSAIPEEIREAIRDWSMQCESNLVITTQGEANTWGYQIQASNLNPNIPVPNISLSIFDGAFGSLAFFNQGGSFQGVFVDIPDTGGEVLAEDGAGRPTIILDEETNDILLADVGILCSNGAGQISPGGNIINNNDILACNIFALGCRLVEGVIFEDQTIGICEGESVTLPDGSLVSEPGTYLDTFITANECDSIIETIVEVVEDQLVVIDNQRCTGDGFSVTVNGNVYDESNPTGEEFIISEAGCDSTVIIDLAFNEPSFNEITLQGCRGDGLSVVVGGTLYDEANPKGEEILFNQFGCDSIVSIDLSFSVVDTMLLDFTRCAGDTVLVDGRVYQAGTTTVERFPVAGGDCDSVLIVTVDAIPLPEIEIDSFVSIEQGVPFTFDYAIPSNLQVTWSPASALSCRTCPDPMWVPGNYPNLYELQLTTAEGCTNSYNILAQYICDPYIPTAFSPNDDGRNDRFEVYHVCPFEGFRMDIYDRWGGKVYESTELDRGWDGFIRGDQAPVGVYAYVVTFVENGQEKIYSGELNLLR
jgi:gliding motility-associated-like protein